MNNSTKFTLIVDKINRMISELNIQLSKDSENENLKNKLNILIKDRDQLYKGTREDIENLIEKYGEHN